MTQAAPPERSCADCQRRIDRCAFCDDPDCDAAVCWRCVTVALGQATPQLHDHGG